MYKAFPQQFLNNRNVRYQLLAHTFFEWVFPLNLSVPHMRVIDLLPYIVCMMVRSSH